ncbi:facilitated trehalose transporter Tret1-like isoform X1 [Diorhabda carinulata]|uniref:facilitated trehalose transporter Tret1-like isoform X1 n=2 Tax=Diorhabda carinulata TaxID=1163345 RepID=UPI0025A2363B|nr:facilitated trehalose transporter Tret1-like isoform X1 [Diorhabda carinulata]
MIFDTTNVDLHDARQYSKQVLAAFSGTILAISDGMTFAWTSPMTLYLISEESHIKTTKEAVEWLETAFLVGCLSGIPLTLYSVDKFGRKRSLVFVSLMMLFGWLLIGFANQMIYLFLARVLAGIASNMVYVVCPMYMSELSDENIRGLLSGIMMVMDHAGSLLVYSLGTRTPYYVSPLLGCSIVMFQIIIFSFMPDSPFYLVSINQLQKAKEALIYFKPYKCPDNEIKTIQQMLHNEQSERRSALDIFRSKTNRKVLTIITFLNLSPQLLGYSVIVMNLHVILEAAGSIYINSYNTGIISGVIMLVATIICSVSVDKFGRRILIMVSSIISGLCVLALAVYFNFKFADFNTEAISWIPIVSVIIFCLFFKIGIGIIPMIVNAEIAPSSIRAVSVTYGDGLKIFGSIISIQIYQFVTKAAGLFVPFYIYSCWAFILALYTFLYIPETKGHSLEEIQRILHNDGNNQQIQE